MRRRSVVHVLLSILFVAAIGCEDDEPSAPIDGGGDDDGGGGEAGAGITLEIEGAEIAADGTATATVLLTDAEGNALQRTGADGTIEVSFVLAHLARDASGNAGQYTAYTTRTQTSPDTGESAVQAAGESDGTWEELGNGRYRYTFSTNIDVTDPTETHTVGAWAERETEEGSGSDDDTFDFVPAGGEVQYRRELTNNEACDQCHTRLSAHGGARREIALCITCHSPQTVDPDTGNTVDMKVMAHKIHFGAGLPSVEQGTPYVIVGYMQRPHDYSTVEFPTPNRVNNCQDCHTGDHWKTNLSQETCTSCHDRTWFGAPEEIPEGWEQHGGGPQPNDNCEVCHAMDLPGLPPTSVVNAHRVELFAPDRPEPQLEIVSVTNTGPGQAPTITFTVAVQDQPRDILAEPLTALRATIVGPNTDFARYWQSTIQGTGAGGTLVAGSRAGEFVWTAPDSAAIPANATGSYTVALEGNITTASNTRIPAFAPMMAVAVTDAAPMERRAVIESEKCDACHERLSFHGGNRANAQYCTACHNPNNVNEERISRVEGQEIYVHTVQLANMIHRIHMGEELTQDYILGGNPTPSAENPQGTPHNFAEVRYPSPRTFCEKCHADGTHRLRSSTAGLLPAFDQIFACEEDPAADEDQLCEPFSSSTPDTNAFVPIQTIMLAPQTAACVGCHDAPSTLAHAMVNTTAGGAEACATCHGPDADFEAHGDQ